MNLQKTLGNKYFLHFLTKNTKKTKCSVYFKAIWMKTTSSGWEVQMNLQKASGN